MECIAESKKRSEFSCLLTLDIKPAFNNALRTDILRFLEELGVEPWLLGLIDDYLWYRSVFLSDGEHYFDTGVPQGSCLGPYLCLVVIEIFLRRLVENRNEAWIITVCVADIFVAARHRDVMRFADLFGPVPLRSTSGLRSATSASAMISADTRLLSTKANTNMSRLFPSTEW